MVGLRQPTLPLDTVHSFICHFSPRAVIKSRTDIFIRRAKSFAEEIVFVALSVTELSSSLRDL